MRRSTPLVAALMCALGLLVPPSPAPALAATAGPAAAELPKREMHDEVFLNDKGWLIFKGNVDPGWSHRNIQVYKRLCKSCEWKIVKKVSTDDAGRWRTRIYAPPTGSWYWKGLVPRAGGYGKSVTQTWRTFVE